MSAHRRVRTHSTKVRRTLTAAVLAVATGAGFLAAAGPANAAGPWYVATAPTGANNATCGLSPATPCATVSFVLAKGAFADGDVINVAAGTYTDRPAFGAKSANVQGAGAATTIFTGGNTSFAMSVNVTNAKTFRLSSASLTQGRGAIGAALPITSGQAVLTNVTITNSVATNAGGGVSVPAGGSLTMNTATISSSSATNGGGAIYNAGTVSLTDVVLTGNTSALGGGIYAPAGTTTNLTNGTVNGNTGTGAAGGVYGLGTLNVNGTTFNANSSPLGAAVAAAGAPTFTGATISNNISTNQGGGIYVNTGTLTVNGGTSITGNKAPTGAGIYQEAGTTNISGSAITNNISSANGGGFYSKAGSFNLTNTVVTGNSATTLGGAGVVLAGTSAITGGSLSGNSSLNAGGLYTGGTTTIDGTTLTANAANGGATTNGGNAGAVYNTAALVVKNATFNGNKVVANTNATQGVTGYGGAILSLSLTAAGAPTVSLTNTTINGDNAGTPVTGGNAAIGGAIAAIGNIGAGGAATNLTATGLTLSKNVALAGGGIYSTGPVSLTNSTVDQNKATHASAGIGGGIYATAQAASTPTLTLDNTDVTANDGVAGGGGIVTTIPTTVKNGSSVSNNTGAVGGGIFSSAAVAVQSSAVDGNSASNSGGGIYSSALVTLTNSSVDDNSAAFAGGGLSTTTTGGYTMTGGSVSGNDAFAAGGVLIGDNLTASFDGTDFIGNTSSGANFGGGAILSGGKVTVDHATISGNTADGASGSGGAIFSGSSNENVNTTLKVTNSTITDNESFVGSAIFAGSSKASSTNKVSISNTTIHANTASGPFGAIETTAPTSIVGSTITDNTAVPTSPFDAYGGIVAQSAGLVSLSGSILSGNSGHQCNVAVADGGYNLNSPTASECGFSAAKNDVFAVPQLGALANNGGPTQTRLPGPTSPALNRIPAGMATGVNDAISGGAITLCGGGATDQRGTARPQGAKCDIGAVEADQVVPTIAGPSSATFSVGIAGAPQTFTTTGSPQPTLSTSLLPAGITFVDNGDGTGTLAGTPGPGTGGVHTITVTATNEAGSTPKTFTLTINQAPTLAGPAGATYTVGQPGGPSLFTSTGHPTATLSSTGTLPGGVGFTDNGDGTGAYAGTPSAGTGGSYSLTVHATNGTAPDASAPFALTVNEAASLTGPGSATFKVGTAGSSTPDFVATGFPVPMLSATGLPGGLSLVSTGSGTAKISGTAANGTGGLYPGVQVTATNGVGSPATKTVGVTVNEAPELTGPTEARFVTGSANSIGFSSDGYPVATITQSGKPSWMTFTDNGNGSASFSGTAPANAVGTYAITVTASNGQSPDAVIHLTLEVVPPLAISTTTLPNAAYRSAYSAQVMSTGGQPGYTYAITVGQLPAGLSMNQFGLITGSPTVSSGLYIFTVKATDSANPAQTATKILKIQVVKGNTTTTPTAILLGFPANGDITINAGQVEADLVGGFPAQPIANATITFKSGGSTVCSGKTDVKGHVKCNQNPLNAILTPLRGTLTATFAGDTNWNGSSGTTTLIARG